MMLKNEAKLWITEKLIKKGEGLFARASKLHDKLLNMYMTQYFFLKGQKRKTKVLNRLDYFHQCQQQKVMKK